jgi:hypothetical protein
MTLQEILQIASQTPLTPAGPRGFMGWLEQPHVKWAVPLPLLLAIAPLVWLFFRKTWRELDEEALASRLARAELQKGDDAVYRGSAPAHYRVTSIDYRPLIALAMGAVILTLQEYYGGRVLYDDIIRKWIATREVKHPGGILANLARYDELYALGWWAFTRMGGYVLPLVLWRIFFRKDSILDFGLRTKGFLGHAWIYGLFVAVMIPTMQIVARQPDFGTYYPFYKNASRSWMDFGMWEALYIGQFFCLEIFFRGWWVRACRSFGAAAIFSMVVPYCMIHYGKPYLEACGAIVAGTVLGSLSMKTRSIYAGFLVHITVAILMDCLALDHRKALPTLITADGKKTLVLDNFHLGSVHGVQLIFWIVWFVAIGLLLVKLVRTWPKLAAWWSARNARATA